jgi:hypothetical protein
MVVDQLERVLTFLAIGAALSTLVAFVSLLGFLIYDGWQRRKGITSPFDAVQRQPE